MEDVLESATQVRFLSWYQAALSTEDSSRLAIVSDPTLISNAFTTSATDVFGLAIWTLFVVEVRKKPRVPKTDLLSCFRATNSDYLLCIAVLIYT